VREVILARRDLPPWSDGRVGQRDILDRSRREVTIMKLAEALALRADAQKQLAQLKQRVVLSARHQEGEAPPEDPGELLAEADRLLQTIEDLIRRINRTNTATELDPGMTVSDALARRDVLGARRAFLAEIAQAASLRQDRYSRSEVKFVTSLDVAELRREVDRLSKEYRELDARLQSKNWETDVLE
jgi:hypothetical protein